MPGWFIYWTQCVWHERRAQKCKDEPHVFPRLVFPEITGLVQFAEKFRLGNQSHYLVCGSSAFYISREIYCNDIRGRIDGQSHFLWNIKTMLLIVESLCPCVRPNGFFYWLHPVWIMSRIWWRIISNRSSSIRGRINALGCVLGRWTGNISTCRVLSKERVVTVRRPPRHRFITIESQNKETVYSLVIDGDNNVISSIWVYLDGHLTWIDRSSFNPLRPSFFYPFKDPYFWIIQNNLYLGYFCLFNCHFIYYHLIYHRHSAFIIIILSFIFCFKIIILIYYITILHHHFSSSHFPYLCKLSKARNLSLHFIKLYYIIFYRIFYSCNYL